MYVSEENYLRSTEGLNGGDDDGGDDKGGGWFDVLKKALPFAIDAIKAMGQGNDKNGVEALLGKFISNNSLWLYPRAEHGGQWPKKGAGDIDRMNEDELRYFIEWRLPLYLKFVRDINNFEPGTKTRVQNRYKAATKGLIDYSKDKFKERFGCYQHSGLYKGVGQAGSFQIKHFNQNCPESTVNRAGVGGNISQIVFILGITGAAIALSRRGSNKAVTTVEPQKTNDDAG